MYRLDSSLTPPTAQGLEALVTKPSFPPEPRKYREGGNLQELPGDPWGTPSSTAAPATTANTTCSHLGADGEEGGDGPGKDINQLGVGLPGKNSWYKMAQTS